MVLTFFMFQIIIPLADIAAIYKRNTAYVFPNAIEIVTKDRQKVWISVNHPSGNWGLPLNALLKLTNLALIGLLL